MREGARVATRDTVRELVEEAHDQARRRDGPPMGGLPGCGERLYKKDLVERLRVCPKCGHHLRMGALDRIALLADGDFEEIAANLVTGDPLQWTDRISYALKSANDRTKSGCSRESSPDSARSTTCSPVLPSWTSRFAAARWEASSARRSRSCLKESGAAPIARGYRLRIRRRADGRRHDRADANGRRRALPSSDSASSGYRMYPF